MSPHKPQSDLHKVEVDFVEILAGVENAHPPTQGNSHELELLGSAVRKPRRAPPRIGESTAVNMTFATIAFSGALICAFYFLKSPEISRRLHTGSAGEFLYPRPGVEFEGARMSDRTGSTTDSGITRHSRQDSETTGLFRNLANASSIAASSPASFVNQSFSSPLTANQTPVNFANAGQAVAVQSGNVGQSGMSQMHSAMSERAGFKRNLDRSSAYMMRSASITRQSLIENARRGQHGIMLGAMQTHSGQGANQVQNRIMSGGLISHALQTGDLGGNVHLRHHGARR